jgi:DNA-binding NtrC family response regulator
MALLSSADWRAAQAIAGIGHVNPFLPERTELERRALGSLYKDFGPIIWARPGAKVVDLFGNVPAMHERAETFAARMRAKLAAGHDASRTDLLVYEDLVLYLLYARSMSTLDGLVFKSTQKSGWDGTIDPNLWKRFENDFHHFFEILDVTLPSQHDQRVIFAGYFQIERAFSHIYSRIIGGSMPAARLRAAVWHSVFSRDMRRYIRTLHDTMVDVPTLIVGPSGTGKELVARAIGLSCFIPFDPLTHRFAVRAANVYVPLNLSALAPTLIESELFGHVRGAFSGAHKDRSGWLEQCGEYGAVFLDEIGELDPGIQVKLLRVLESRKFQKVGGTESIGFKGKIIAATNRDLSEEIEAGRFRRDFYYRLCADQIATPSLAQQLADRPEDLAEMVRFIAGEALAPKTDPTDGSRSGQIHDDGFQDEVEQLTDEVVTWIDRELGRDYDWPGNFRELGQCVRNIMIRGSYCPHKATSRSAPESGPVDELLRQVREVEVTADELLGRYYALALDRSDGSYSEAGRRVNVDWRVVKNRLDVEYLGRLRKSRIPLRALG